jgi:hypothetical protein
MHSRGTQAESWSHRRNSAVNHWSLTKFSHLVCAGAPDQHSPSTAHGLTHRVQRNVGLPFLEEIILLGGSEEDLAGRIRTDTLHVEGS